MTNLPIPPLGDSISQVTLLRWLKNDGDYVRVDEPLAELETDKANTDLSASVAGVLRQMKKAGDIIKVGENAATIDESAPTPAGVATKVTPSAAKAPAPAGAASTQAGASTQTGANLDDLNPSARRQVIENGLDPAQIPASGPHGRLLGSDVAEYLAGRGAASQDGGNGSHAPAGASTGPASAQTPMGAQVAPPQPVIDAPRPRPAPIAPPSAADLTKPRSADGPLQFNADGIARVPLSKIRKRTALNLKLAQNTAAILTTFNEIDMSAISELRARHKERFEKAYGVGLGFMSFFARAVVLALREFPRVNASIEEDDIVYHNYVNLGIAVSADRGLTVPILRHAEQMSFARIESEIKRVANAVREGKLGLQELSGGTFTITNGGVFGSLLSTPILNPPQSAILGMHTIQKRPVAVGDKVEIHPMMYVALSYDHRLIDGRESVSFLVRVKEYLEDPTRLMFEI